MFQTAYCYFSSFSLFSDFRRKGQITGAAGAGLLLLVVVATPFSWPVNRTRPLRYDPYVKPPYVEFLQRQQQPFRILALDKYLYPETAGVFGLDDIRFLDAVFPKTYTDFAESLLYQPEETVRFTGTESSISYGVGLDLLNVKYVVTAADNPDFPRIVGYGSTSSKFEAVYQDADVIIYQNHDALPRAFVLYNAESVQNTEQALARLRDPNFDPRQTIFIEGAPSIQRSDSGLPFQEAKVLERSANTITLEATLDQPGYLVVSEQNFPGWKAYVDGQEAKIYTADAIMRAVYLDKGTHRVEYVFMPDTFVVGVLISAATLLSLGLALAFVSARPGKRQENG